MDRVGASGSPSPAAKMTAEQLAEKLSFVTPTEHVELPSRGLFYPPNHPLHGQETIEIKHMTAKEEDILTSRSLLKKGVAIDRVLKNIVLDPRIDPNTLLTGDRNAVIMATRISAYGAQYKATVTCPSCQTTSKFGFILDIDNMYHGECSENMGLRKTDRGTFMVTLPVLGIDVEFRLMNGYDEKKIVKGMEKDQKSNDSEHNITRMLENIVVSVAGLEDPDSINMLIDKMPTMDSRHLRTSYKMVNPDVDTVQTFECSSCEYTQDMEVPMTAEFFWPDT